MSIELQTPVEMLKRWQGIECTCDPDVGHICEVCHDIQVVKGLMAENQRLREALSYIRDFVVAPWSASNVQAVARQALEGGGDDDSQD